MITTRIDSKGEVLIAAIQFQQILNGGFIERWLLDTAALPFDPRYTNVTNEEIANYVNMFKHKTTPSVV